MTDPQLNFFTNRKSTVRSTARGASPTGHPTVRSTARDVSHTGHPTVRSTARDATSNTNNAQLSPSGLCPRGASRNSKYGNRATGDHASRKEHRRALELQLLERAGHITDLRQQVPFQLIPAQYEQPQQPPQEAHPPSAPASCGAQGATPPKPSPARASGPSAPAGPARASGPSTKPRLIERPCTYIADFVYTDPTTGQQIVEDTKGMRTEVYKIKRKLMLYIHGIRIKET